MVRHPRSRARPAGLPSADQHRGVTSADAGRSPCYAGEQRADEQTDSHHN